MRIFLMFVFSLGFQSQSDAVQVNRPGYRSVNHSMRYQSHYRHWNSGFTRYYGYRETECTIERRSYGTLETCYDLGPQDVVYVWERRSGNYRHISVYRDRYYNDPLADYWVYDDGHVHTVRARRWRNHPRYHDNAYCWSGSPYDGYWSCHPTTVIVVVDFSTAEGKLITGAEAIVIGGAIAGNASTDAGKAIGIGLAVSGSISLASGLKQLHKESELAKAVEVAKTEADSESTDIK